MNYSKKEIGKALIEELNKGYNIERISNWADELFFSIREKRSPELDDILSTIFMMDAGPEFAYSEEELRLIANKLINNEEDPFKQINDMKSKEFD